MASKDSYIPFLITINHTNYLASERHDNWLYLKFKKSKVNNIIIIITPKKKGQKDGRGGFFWGKQE
jgi:hypothetical protein